MKTTTYVNFYYPGVIFADTSSNEVEDRNIYKLNIPDDAYAFRFFDVKTTVIDGEILKGEKLNYSPLYYPDGRIMTIEEIRWEMPDKRILIENMNSNNWNEVVKTRRGNIIPFITGDIVFKLQKRRHK